MSAKSNVQYVDLVPKVVVNRVPDFDKEVMEPIKKSRLEAEERARKAKLVVNTQPVVNVTLGSSKVLPSGDIWYQLALCESGARWNYDGPSGFDGGLQFLPSTWTSMGTGYTYAWQAPAEVQIDAGKRLQARAGWGQWPACARKLGLL